MKRSLSFSRSFRSATRSRVALAQRVMRSESGAKTPRTPKALRAKCSRLFGIVLLWIIFSAQQASACPFCYGAKDGKSTQHMAVAIWFLFGAVMSVIGGIGAFSFHLWRHGRMPVEPHQELTEEDLSKYE
jgi:hypothetical protein